MKKETRKLVLLATLMFSTASYGSALLERVIISGERNIEIEETLSLWATDQDSVALADDSFEWKQESGPGTLDFTSLANMAGAQNIKASQPGPYTVSVVMKRKDETLGYRRSRDGLYATH